ncbi:hypothetical protein Poli38472_007007 [Pythium oligandrum]|uniref:Structure-specific endonuclease subunit SLX1 homolog n=1 Tax=Pythium oligandrum TaxID=41045 RepID=A0A8K1FGM5_PYTOL|nr:hypothetical protein Poli38472_007007 [Pythium oligandrum]|eukprot:TMW58862.1 hypothetical protein Poli38472_007007 [Pythium oligandrum]
MPTEFFACYLLTPVNAPQRLRATYVGFTVSPTRRIRQHNGELVSGAKRTRRHRPWEMIVVVHGFPTKFHALQFEFAWQHPYICRFTKERLSALRGKQGVGTPRSVKRKLVELHEMLHILPWTNFPLTISYTSLAIQSIARATTYFTWPAHMACEVRMLSEFATLVKNQNKPEEVHPDASSVCYVCEERLDGSTLRVLRCYHTDCATKYHSLCLADHFLLHASLTSEEANGTVASLRPERGPCPQCEHELQWPLLVKGASVQPAASSRHEDDDEARHATLEQETEEASSRGSYSYSDNGWFEEDDAYQDKDTMESEPRSGGRPGESGNLDGVVIDLTMDDEDEPV